MSDTAESNAQGPDPPRPWLLLIHQLPAEPAYLRVKVSRRLRALGAVALKNSVYALPDTESTREDLVWVRREILDGGGEAMLARAGFLAGTTDAEVEAEMRAERRAEYEAVAGEARELADGSPTRAEVQRLRRRLDEIASRDHLSASGRAVAEQAIALAEARQRGAAAVEPRIEELPRGATWVTRRGVFVDRTASAWLIRRFLDPGATLRFVEPAGYEPAADEIPFDMFEGGYTHEGDRCTFETLLVRFGRDADAALRAIGEIVHDIDCKDGRFGRPETPGIAGLIHGIAAAHERDEDRVDAAAHVWDGLYAHFATA